MVALFVSPRDQDRADRRIGREEGGEVVPRVHRLGVPTDEAVDYRTSLRWNADVEYGTPPVGNVDVNCGHG